VGWITSGGFGHFLGAPIGLGYVKRADGDVVAPDWINTGAWSIEVAGTTYAATASLRPFYDPTSARVKGV
jgi:4-methylaminobutanoate oxidase (formaldehyde-forming)